MNYQIMGDFPNRCPGAVVEMLGEENYQYEIGLSLSII
jgi:hypothetical protein